MLACCHCCEVGSHRRGCRKASFLRFAKAMSAMAERYMRASKSSHLKLEVEPGDVDVIIAAGFADSLGTMLLRCRQQWDAQRAELAKHDNLTGRVLVMMAMRSVTPTYLALQNYGAQRAARRGMNLQDSQIADIVGNALDVWLDQRCNHCNGTKETGLFGGPRAICNRCKGTGTRRRVMPSKTTEELALGEWLIAEADRLVEAAQRKMSQALR